MKRRIEGFVLAGGKSSRMGRDKSVLMIDGRTLIDHAAEGLSSVADPVWVVGNIDATKTSLPVVPDIEVAPQTRGSIIGLYTAAVNAKTPWMAILACDLPFISTELLHKLSELIPDVENACKAILPSQSDGRVQPLCGFYATDKTRYAIEQMLVDGNWRLQELAKRLDARVVKFDELAHFPNSENFFFNVNTPEDYNAALLIQRARGGLFQ